ncbi:SPOR domain-containing protein [uncultured Sphingomonas sp.]|uniref:SPOR domain-containing protein n=1 Tax=uncultured Sphingomonas sp. TaxID=158754 RepID=UPI0035CA1FA8
MTKRTIAAGMSALAMCAACGGAAFAGARTAAQMAREAQVDSVKATRAIAGRKVENAVRYAEAAVALQPQSASYRALLGQAYLLAGRFGSARTAFADSLSLEPGEGKTALNLALAQVADGDWSGARATLDANSGSIPVADRGLALALAGDPAAGVELLLPIARSAGATPKVRQNLALALALAGRWQDAKVVAAMDLAPADVDQRIMQWATFARPTGKADQVAALLGVTPAADPGQPVALALDAAAPLASSPAAIDRYMPAAPTAKVLSDAATDAGVAVPAAVADPGAMSAPTAIAGVTFGPRAEVIQPLPTRLVPGTPVPETRALKMVTTARKIAAPIAGAPAPSVGKGEFYVQLGAYDNAAVARDAWTRAVRGHAGLVGQVPLGVTARVKSRSFYRLSVGGFDRASADRMCRSYRATGGACFVRTGAGDKATGWATGWKR